VASQEAQKLANELKINFIETSAKDNRNVEEVSIALDCNCIISILKVV